jgi:hypothetical protein
VTAFGGPANWRKDDIVRPPASLVGLPKAELSLNETKASWTDLLAIFQNRELSAFLNPFST